MMMIASLHDTRNSRIQLLRPESQVYNRVGSTSANHNVSSYMSLFSYRDWHEQDRRSSWSYEGLRSDCDYEWSNRMDFLLLDGGHNCTSAIQLRR